MKRTLFKKAEPYLYMIPLLTIILPLLIYPIFRSVIMSLFDLRGLEPELTNYAGLSNYQQIFSSARFLNSLKTTILYTLFCVTGTILVGLGTAMLLNSKFRGRTIARVSMTIPWAVPEVAVVMIWVFMLDPNYGVINFVFSKLGIVSDYVRWFNGVDTAFYILIVMTIWKIFPFSTIVILTALKTVPEELYEVARIDGAGVIAVFRKITLPLIRPTLMLIILLNTIWSFKRFTLTWLSTQGGPAGTTETLVVLVYKYTFQMYKPGVAAAVGVMGLILTLLISSAYFFIQKRQGD